MYKGSETLTKFAYILVATMATLIMFDIEPDKISFEYLFMAFILVACFSALCKSIESLKDK